LNVRTDLHVTTDAHIPGAVCNPAVRAGSVRSSRGVAPTATTEVVAWSVGDADADATHAAHSPLGRDPERRRLPGRRHDQLA